MPVSFDVDGGAALVLVRGLAVAALLSLLGTLSFSVFVAPRALLRTPPPAAGMVTRRLQRLTQISIAAAVAAMLGWFVLQGADMAGTASLAKLLAAAPAIANTLFGRLVILQLAALLATAIALKRGRQRARLWAALGGAGAAIALQAGHSHAASMYSGPSLLLVADLAHLWAAGAWLGGLLPLLLFVQAAPPKAAATAARWFSPLGQICLIVLTLTALFQGWVMVGSIPGLVGTAYGWMALVKLGLFGVLFAFAWFNRYRFAPALLQGRPQAARRVLIRSIALQTGFGLAIVAAATVLSSLPPAMHEQALWPFSDQLTLDTVQEDPDFLNEVLEAAAALAGAGLLLLGALLARRIHTGLRWAAVACAVAIGWFAAPHLDLLFIPAYPTSFYRSPTGFAATSIVAGSALYANNCTACHGLEGRGDGPAAAGLPVPPADLTAAHLLMHSDGELFWWLTHGIDAPEGGLAMPGFASVLSEDDRWNLIDFIRARNVGEAFRSTGVWPQPVQAPGFEAACADGRTVTLAQLRGGFVRLSIGVTPADTAAGLTTIVATADPAAQPQPGQCIAADETLPQAYAIALGRSPGQMTGLQVLIDGDGWLRAIQPPGVVGWNDPQALASEIASLRTHKLAAAPAMSHMQMPM